jgi:hypothetical protein
LVASVFLADAAAATEIRVPEKFVVAGNVGEAATPAHVRTESLDGDTFAFEIDGRLFEAVHPMREAYAGGDIIRFRVAGAPSSSTITREGGRVAVTLVTPTGTYHIDPVAGRGAVISREGDRNTRRLEADSASATNFEARLGILGVAVPDSLGQPKRRAATSFPITVHRQIAFYSARFAAHYGNESAVRFAIQHLFDVRDTALVDSFVFGIRDTLVYAVQRDDLGVRVGAHPAELLAQFAVDPEVQRLRVAYQSNAGYWDDDPLADAGGYAVIYDGRTFPADGTYVVEWSERVARSAAHELGHVGGAEHEKEKAVLKTCPYCYGWYNNSGRDIMVVGCNGSCHDQMFYSNPSHLWNGVQAGSDEQNAARLLSETRYLVRDFWMAIPAAPP